MKQFILKRRKKLEKRAFTIVETLAIIVILGVMAIITIPNIAGIYENQTATKEQKIISFIESAAEAYDINTYNQTAEKLITITELVEEGYLDSSLFADTDINLADPNLGIYKHTVDGKTTYEYMEDTSEVVIEEPAEPFDPFLITFGSNDNDDAFNSAVADDNGNYLVVGTFRETTCDITAAVGGREDGFIVKYDSLGNKLWDKAYRGFEVGEGQDAFNNIIRLSDGNYLAVGKSNDGHNVNGYYYGWAVKIDGDGNPIWNKLYSTEGDYEFFEAIETSDGDYLLAGGSGSEIYVVKTDTSGNVIWEKTFNDASDVDADEILSVVETADKKYILVGSTSASDGYVTDGNYGGRDALILKITTAGLYEWDITYGGTSDDYFTSIIKTNDSNYLAVGYSASTTNDLSGKNIGSTDGILLKFKDDKTILWQENVGGTDVDQIYDVLQETTNDFVVVGRSKSTDIAFTSTPQNTYDAFLIRTDAAGIVKKDLIIGGYYYERFKSITALGDGRFLTTGFTCSNDFDITDPICVPDSFSNDALFVKLEF